MMTLHTLVDRIKLMLSISGEDRDSLITEIIRLSAMPILAYINQNEIPPELEWILVELCIARYNRIGAEGLSEEQSDNIRNKYEENVLQKYTPYLDRWIEDNMTESPTETPKVRFF